MSVCLLTWVSLTLTDTTTRSARPESRAAGRLLKTRGEQRAIVIAQAQSQSNPPRALPPKPHHKSLERGERSTGRAEREGMPLSPPTLPQGLPLLNNGRKITQKKKRAPHYTHTLLYSRTNEKKTQKQAHFSALKDCHYHLLHVPFVEEKSCIYHFLTRHMAEEATTGSSSPFSLCKILSFVQVV